MISGVGVDPTDYQIFRKDYHNYSQRRDSIDSQIHDIKISGFDYCND